MSDIFEVTSENKNDLRAFASFNKFTFIIKESWIRAPEVSVDLTPSQAIDLAERLVAFAKAEIDKETNSFQMGTPGIAHADEDESFSMSKNTKQAFDHALATGGNIVGDTLSVMISEAAENKEVKPSTGQIWTHKQKGYDVKIDYINRTGDVVVEEVATGQRDGFGREIFLERFSPKNKDSDS